MAMVADEKQEKAVYAKHLRDELVFIEGQLERAWRKEEAWTVRRRMLEQSAARTREELERLA